jgi:hypothetical protein
MFGITQNLWTYQLSNQTLIIDESYGLTAVSLVLNSGTGTFTGGSTLINGVTSLPIDLVIGQPVTIPSNSGTSLNNLEITTTGVLAIIGFQ